MNKLSELQTARLKLTGWYVVITIFLLAVFSVGAIQAEKRAFSKIEQALSDREQRPKLTALLETRIAGFEKNFRQRLFTFDVVLLLISAVSSYFLSAKTLEPIAKMMREQEEFAADASHELRTPLATIGMEIESQMRTEKLPGNYRLTLASIKEEVSRMGKIVDGLLRLVRAEAGEARLQTRIFNLTEVAGEVVDQMKPLAENKHVVLSLESAKQLKVKADREQIRQVVVILVDNAIKYTPSGGNVKLSLGRQKNWARLQVQDTGAGISSTDLSHIFKRFWRGQGNSDGESKGVGLGLPIAKQIAENHHGKLSVFSELGKGSGFTLSLPVYS